MQSDNSGFMYRAMVIATLLSIIHAITMRETTITVSTAHSTLATPEDHLLCIINNN